MSVFREISTPARIRFPLSGFMPWKTPRSLADLLGLALAFVRPNWPWFTFLAAVTLISVAIGESSPVPGSLAAPTTTKAPTSISVIPRWNLIFTSSGNVNVIGALRLPGGWMVIWVTSILITVPGTWRLWVLLGTSWIWSATRRPSRRIMVTATTSPLLRSAMVAFSTWGTRTLVSPVTTTSARPRLVFKTRIRSSKALVRNPSTVPKKSMGSGAKLDLADSLPSASTAVTTYMNPTSSGTSASI